VATRELLEQILIIRRRIDCDTTAKKDDLWAEYYREIDKARSGTHYSIDQMIEAIERKYIEVRRLEAKQNRDRQSSLLQSPPGPEPPPKS
jgi:hypothetical protein